MQIINRLLNFFGFRKKQYRQYPKPFIASKFSKDRYLIEMRFIDRGLKSQMKDLERGINRRFHFWQKHFVPHITIVGGFKTNNENLLLTDFYKICSDSSLMRFRVKGFSSFDNPQQKVVFLDIEPSEELKIFRYHLAQKLKNYCQLTQFDFNNKDEFVFHSTVVLNAPAKQFEKIKNFVNRAEVPHRRFYLVRATILKNNRIYREYDFFLRKMLNRTNARNPFYYHKTQAALNRYLRRSR